MCQTLLLQGFDGMGKPGVRRHDGHRFEGERTIDYIEWKPTSRRKTIQPGERFTVGDILVADHQVTRAAIGLWLITGRAEVVAPEPLPEIKNSNVK